MTICSPNALFFNTGKLQDNPDLKEKPSSVEHSDFKFNDFVVYDENQIKMRYLVHCNCVEN